MQSTREVQRFVVRSERYCTWYVTFDLLFQQTSTWDVRIVTRGGGSKVNWTTLGEENSPVAAVGEPPAEIPPAARFPVTASHPIDGPLELMI